MLKKKASKSEAHGNNMNSDIRNFALPDNMGVDMLLRQIGVEHSWPENQINSDINVLTKNRIFLIRDLRILSNESWKDIELLPIVKDLCREAINFESNQRFVNDSNTKKKLSKKVSLDSLVSKFYHHNHHPSNEFRIISSKNFNKSNLGPIPYETPQSTFDSIPYETPQSTLAYEIPRSPLTPIPSIPYESPQSCAEVNTQKIISDRSPLKSIPPASQKIDVQDDISDRSPLKSIPPTTQKIEPRDDNSPFFMPPPNKKVVGNGNRMKVKTSSGKIYEVDRWCPHSKTDLSSRSVVIGAKLFCAKHKWAFDLENGGKCASACTDATINACPVYDW
ncbi:ammonium transporter [Gigaspora margarita]|uniref:Ammonium transporter n=1 Tax=Gigaspora margarita TaxID=4874 RepID=A0A8H4ASJ1_GIGMA|nr:ammonium transporter [Gigaspora margarita]